MITSRLILTRLPWLTLLIACVCVSLFWWVPYESDSFGQLTLLKTAPGISWSWISANFTHTDINHLFWNIAALCVLGGIVELRDRKLLVAAVVVGVISVDLWFFIQTRFDQYAGLSGVLNTILICTLYASRVPGAVIKGNEMLWLILLLAAAKSIYELVVGTALFSDIRWRTTPSFHLVGMVAGCVLVSFCYFVKTKKRALKQPIVSKANK